MGLKVNELPRIEVVYFEIDPYFQEVGGFKVKGDIDELVYYLVKKVGGGEEWTKKGEEIRKYLRTPKNLDKGIPLARDLDLEIFWYLFPTSEEEVYKVIGYAYLMEDLNERVKEGEEKLKGIFYNAGFEILEEEDVSYR